MAERLASNYSFPSSVILTFSEKPCQRWGRPLLFSLITKAVISIEEYVSSSNSKESICNVIIRSIREHFGAFTTDAQINSGLGLANRLRTQLNDALNDS